jgi:hypothetical protein
MDRRSERDSGSADGDDRGRVSGEEFQDHVVVAAGKGAQVGHGVGADDGHRVAHPEQPRPARPPGR